MFSSLVIGIGKYIYIEASGLKKGFLSNITSVMYPPTSGRCFQFWYHMYGANMGKLELFLLSIGGKKTLLWYKSENQGNKWIRQTVNIKNSTSYQIIFISTAEHGYAGDMALDNLFFTNGICNGKLYIHIFQVLKYQSISENMLQLLFLITVITLGIITMRVHSVNITYDNCHIIFSSSSCENK